MIDLFRRKPIESLELIGIECERNDHVWLKDFNFSLPKGKIWVFEGDMSVPILFQVLVGLQEPSKGQYLINGQNVLDMSFEEFSDYRLNMGFGFFTGGLLNNRTLKENLLLPFQYHGVDAIVAQRLVDEMIELFEMNRYQDLRPYSCPRDARKLCAIARALVTEPQLVVLDDPLGELGTRGSKIFKKYFDWKTQHGGLPTMLMSLDDLNVVKDVDYELITFTEGQMKHNSAKVEKAG